MKKLTLFMVALMSCVASYGAGGADAVKSHGVMVVDSERIFRSLDSYNAALTQIDSLSKAYQLQVDQKFEKVEQAFNKYSLERMSLSATQRSDRETTILVQEKMAIEYQEQHFAENGTIMKRRIELIAPIQSRVFGAIESFATEHGYAVVIDKSANASLLYVAAGVDKTEQIIEKLK